MKCVKEELEASGFKSASTQLQVPPGKGRRGARFGANTFVNGGRQKLRRRLAECRGICEKGDDDSGSALALVPAARPGNLLGLDLGVKLDAAKLRQLWVDFLTTRIRVNNWSATADQPSSLCNRFMGKSTPRCCASFLGNSSSPHGTPGTDAKEKTFVSLLAEASGQQDALEWGPSPSLFVVEEILKRGEHAGRWSAGAILAPRIRS